MLKEERKTIKEHIKEHIEEHTIINETYTCDICGKVFMPDNKNEFHTGSRGKVLRKYNMPYGCKEKLGGNSINLFDDDNEENNDFGQDGCYHHNVTYDICGECMMDKIFPYIKEISGNEPRDTSYDW